MLPLPKPLPRGRRRVHTIALRLCHWHCRPRACCRRRATRACARGQAAGRHMWLYVRRTCSHSHDTPYTKKAIDVIKKFHARRGKMKLENPKGDGKGKKSEGKRRERQHWREEWRKREGERQAEGRPREIGNGAGEAGHRTGANTTVAAQCIRSTGRG